MKSCLPALAWLFCGVGGTLLLCMGLFLLGFLNRDEVNGSNLGEWAEYIGISIYAIMPIGILGSLLMAFSKLRGVLAGPRLTGTVRPTPARSGGYAIPSSTDHIGSVIAKES